MESEAHSTFVLGQEAIARVHGVDLELDASSHDLGADAPEWCEVRPDESRCR